MAKNRVELIGRLGADPELKCTTSGIPVARLSVATTEYSGVGENRKETTEWHSVVVWREKAEWCGNEMRKGDEVAIEGKLASRSYENRDKVKVKVTEVVASEVYRVKSPVKSSQRDQRSSGKPSDVVTDLRTGREPKPSEEKDDFPWL